MAVSIAAIGWGIAFGAQAALGDGSGLGDGALPGAVGEADFSLWAMFSRATITVKIVMVVLVLASFWSGPSSSRRR